MKSEQPIKPPIRVMLKQYIVLSDRSQEQIAQEIGIAPASICRFLAGKDINQDGTIRLIGWMFGSKG
jgi:predicted transcriptional regulator